MVQNIHGCNTFCTQISSLCIQGEESQRYFGIILFKILHTERSQVVKNLSKCVGNMSLFSLLGSFLSIKLNNNKVL